MRARDALISVSALSAAYALRWRSCVQDETHVVMMLSDRLTDSFLELVQMS